MPSWRPLPGATCRFCRAPLRQVLDQGLDLGFFLRELSGCWRNMFLLRQGGQAMVPELGLPAEEAAQWLEWAGRFEPAHIHACWQMTLDGQQRVIKSLEPAQALELLLLNLACLPDLLPLSALGGQGGATSASGAAPRMPSAPAAPAAPVAPRTPPAAAPVAPASGKALADADAAQAQTPPPWQEPASVIEPAPAAVPEAAPVALPLSAPAPVPTQSTASARTWEGFLEFVASKNGSGMVTGLTQARGELCDGMLILTCHNGTHSGMMENGDNNVRLRRLMADYFGPDMTLSFTCADREPVKTDGLIQREMQEHPVVQRVRETFECRDPALVYPRR